MKNLKICVHVPLFLEKRKKKQLNNFKKVCNSFLKLSKKTELFIHSNKKIKSSNKRIKFISHNFLGKYLDCGTIKGYINSSVEIAKL